MIGPFSYQLFKNNVCKMLFFQGADDQELPPPCSGIEHSAAAGRAEEEDYHLWLLFVLHYFFFPVCLTQPPLLTSFPHTQISLSVSLTFDLRTGCVIKEPPRLVLHIPCYMEALWPFPTCAHAPTHCGMAGSGLYFKVRSLDYDGVWCGAFTATLIWPLCVSGCLHNVFNLYTKKC